VRASPCGLRPDFRNTDAPTMNFETRICENCSHKLQRTCAAIRFRNIDPPLRRRKIASTAYFRACRGCSKDQPQSPQSNCPFCSIRSLVGLDPLEGLPDFSSLLRSRDGFSWPGASAEQRSHFGPVTEPFVLTMSQSVPSDWYSDPRGWRRLRSLPLHRRQRFSRSYKRLVELHAA
jgi:hypothetical protein